MRGISYGCNCWRWVMGLNMFSALGWWWSSDGWIQDVCRCELAQINSWSSAFLLINDLQDNIKILLINFSDEKRSRTATNPGDRPRRQSSLGFLLSFPFFNRPIYEISHLANQCAGCSYRWMTPSWEALAENESLVVNQLNVLWPWTWDTWIITDRSFCPWKVYYFKMKNK